MTQEEPMAEQLLWQGFSSGKGGKIWTCKIKHNHEFVKLIIYVFKIVDFTFKLISVSVRCIRK